MSFPTTKSHKQINDQHHSCDQKYIHKFLNLKQHSADQRGSLCQEHIQNNLVQKRVSQFSIVAQTSK